MYIVLLDDVVAVRLLPVWLDVIGCSSSRLLGVWLNVHVLVVDGGGSTGAFESEQHFAIFTPMPWDTT